eukprot:1726129-Rhodomonas_salina.1
MLSPRCNPPPDPHRVSGASATSLRLYLAGFGARLAVLECASACQGCQGTLATQEGYLDRLGKVPRPGRGQTC